MNLPAVKSPEKVCRLHMFFCQKLCDEMGFSLYHPCDQGHVYHSDGYQKVDGCPDEGIKCLVRDSI